MKTPRPAEGGADLEMTRRALRRLEIMVNQKVIGAVHGDYQGIFPGPGGEIGDGRPYIPGDDVRLIDWNLTARTGEPHTRDRIRDHELDAWLVIDLTASTRQGTRGGTKTNLAIFAAAAFGFLASRMANRVGAVLALDGTTTLIPPRPGQAHLRSILHRAATAHCEPAGRTDLGPALRHTAGYATRRGFVAVISDFLVRPDVSVELHRLAARHTLIAVELVDPIDEELPNIGRIRAQDPETGDVVHVDTSDAKLRARYHAAGQVRRARLAATLTRAGADHLPLRTDVDWTAQVVRQFHRRRALTRQYRRPSWTA